MKQVPRKTIYRLSVYLRSLHRLREIHPNEKELTVSSDALAKATNVKPAQLRKDFTHIGQVGKRGLGYQVDELTARLTSFLGTNRLQPVILVGVGNLGSALLTYGGFEKAGFEIVGAFDADPARPRDKSITLPIRPMEELAAFAKERTIKIAIIATPGAHAQETANLLVSTGVVAILNFAPVILLTPRTVIVNNVNVAIELENLAYFIQDN